MSNTLYRAGSSYTIPAVPAAVAQPAYSYFVTETVLLQGPSYESAPRGWGYRLVTDPVTGATSVQLMYLGTLDTGSGVSTQNPSGGSTTTTTTRRVDVPAVEANPGSPAIKVSIPPVGWTSFAHSIATLRSGSASWKVGLTVAGVAMGLSADPRPTLGYGHIKHGLLFTGRRAKHLYTGADYGAFVGSDVFTVVLKGGIITYRKNGADLASEASTFGPIQPLMLSAAMYAPADYVTDPVLSEVLGGGGATTLPPLAAFGGNGTKSMGATVFPAMVTIAPAANHSHTSFQPMAAMGSDRAIYGQGITTLPALVAQGYGGTLPVSLNNGGDTSLGALYGAGRLLVGQTGGGATALKALTAIAADHAYGYGATVFPSMYAVGGTEPADEAYMVEMIAADAPLKASAEFYALMQSSVTVAGTMSLFKELEALMPAVVDVSSTMSAGAVFEAVMRSVIAVNGRLAMPGLDGETWVFNIEAAGSTSYTGYDFNSFAQIGDRFYGANAEGIYELEGDTDAGAPIRASIGLGQLNFGNALQKTISHAYIGMSAKGNLFLKVRVGEGAAAREYSYSTRSFSESLMQQRIVPGKGLKANYFWLELYNENGADFEIDTVEFHVADLSRRI